MRGLRTGLALVMVLAGCEAATLHSSDRDAALPARADARVIADGAPGGGPPMRDAVVDAWTPDSPVEPLDFGPARDAAPGTPPDAALPPIDAASPMPIDAAPPPPARPCPWAPGTQPQKKAIFVDQHPAQDLEIEDELLALFRGAVPGSQVRISLFTWTRTRMADAVIAAAAEADVRIVLDESNQQEDPPGSGAWRYSLAVQRLQQALGDRVTVCNASTPPNGGGCHSSGINHNKFFLFSALCDGSRDVVVQSSANLTTPQLTAHNNMLIIRDDAALYAGYSQYWRDLDSERRDADYYRTVDGSTGTKAYFYPRAGDDQGTDTVHNILVDNVECDAEIRVMMAWWTQARGWLVDDLRRLHQDGCDVRVIVSADASSEALRRHLLEALPDDRVKIAEGVHSKILLVSGGYRGGPRQLVWTGSHNYTGPSLRENDETLLRVDDPDVYRAYRANWQRAWDTLP